MNGGDPQADPKLRGLALVWRAVPVAAVWVPLFTWRFDFATAWLFFIVVGVAAYRIPRIVRLLRAGDAISALPWSMLALGIVAAIVHQSWADGRVRHRYDALVAELGRDPCHPELVLPPVLRPGSQAGTTWHQLSAGLLTYPLFVRRDARNGELDVVLHFNIDATVGTAISTAACAPAPAP